MLPLHRVTSDGGGCTADHSRCRGRGRHSAYLARLHEQRQQSRGSTAEAGSRRASDDARDRETMSGPRDTHTAKRDRFQERSQREREREREREAASRSRDPGDGVMNQFPGQKCRCWPILLRFPSQPSLSVAERVGGSRVGGSRVSSLGISLSNTERERRARERKLLSRGP